MRSSPPQSVQPPVSPEADLKSLSDDEKKALEDKKQADQKLAQEAAKPLDEKKDKPKAKDEKKKPEPVDPFKDIQRRAAKIRDKNPALAAPDIAYKGGPFEQRVKALKKSLLAKVAENKGADAKKIEEARAAINVACTALLEKGKEVIGRPFEESAKPLEEKDFKKAFTDIPNDATVKTKFDDAFTKIKDLDPTKAQEVDALKTEKAKDIQSMADDKAYTKEMDALQKKTKRRDEMSIHLDIAQRNNRFNGTEQWRLISQKDLEYNEAAEAKEPMPAGQFAQKINPDDPAKIELFEKAVDRFKKGLKNKEEMVWHLESTARAQKKVRPGEPGWDPNLIGKKDFRGRPYQYVDDPDKTKTFKNPFQVRVTKEGNLKTEYTPEAHRKWFNISNMRFRPRQFARPSLNDPLYGLSIQTKFKAGELIGSRTFNLKFPKEVKTQKAVDRRIRRIEAHLDEAYKNGRVKINFKDPNIWKALEMYKRYHGAEGAERVAKIEKQWRFINQKADDVFKREKDIKQSAKGWKKETQEQMADLKKANDYKVEEIKAEVQGVAVSAKSSSFTALDKALGDRTASVDSNLQTTLQLLDKQIGEIKGIRDQDPDNADDPELQNQLEELQAMYKEARLMVTDDASAKEIKAFAAQIGNYTPPDGKGQPPLTAAEATELQKRATDMQDARSKHLKELDKRGEQIGEQLEEIRNLTAYKKGDDNQARYRG